MTTFKEALLTEAALKSKKLLFQALDEFFKTDEYSKKGLKAKGLSDETYGKKSMIYVRSKDNAERKELEKFLKSKGFKVHESYHPGSANSEIEVSYFKGWHWDESRKQEGELIAEAKGQKVWVYKMYRRGDEDDDSLFDDFHVCSSEATAVALMIDDLKEVAEDL